MSRRALFTIMATLLLSTPLQAFASCDLDQVVGYTLFAKKYVAAYIEDGVRKDGFEGCNYGRVLVFDDNTGVTRTTYSYSYSYHPVAYIFGNGSGMKACIADSIYDVGQVR